MAKVEKSVFDTGPFMHLNEIGHLGILSLFQEIDIPVEVLDEFDRNLADGIKKLRNVLVKSLKGEHKDLAKYLLEQYDIELGEVACMALCKQERIGLFFTDDLEAREVASNFGLNAHGTLAIVTRCLRERVVTKDEAKKMILEIHEKSSLFLTTDLKEWALGEIDKFSS
ncbi:hypothetical protein HY570_02405 [Candidatus Micrarchaeota archaeon]|nr:hypothetical protein [Candidatus Micrarchaeota archaeon]